MHHPADDVVWAEALFTSHIQESDTVSPETVRHTVEDLLQREGVSGCAAQMAYEYGEHPGAAARRMTWARRVVRDIRRAPMVSAA